MKIKTGYRLLIHVILCLLIGSSGAYFTAQSVDTWYPTLNKPFFNPPNYVFGPVWTIIFILLGFCLWGILKSNHEEKNKALTLFIIQFLFNIAWSYFFFGIESPLLALIDIIFLWIILLLFIIQLFKIKKWIAYTQILYFLWVSFATILNASIVYLN